MFEEPAEPLTAHDLALREGENLWLTRIGDRKRHVTPALVRPLFVIMVDELFHEMPQMLLTADHEVIEALDAERLNESFRVGIHRCNRMHRIRTLKPERFA